MLYVHLRLFLLAMIGVSIAVMPAHAQAASERFRLPKLSFVDVSLDEPAGTVRQSQPFTIDEKSYRLFVRDTDVMTTRGPHDRVCVEAISHPTARDRPHFTLTLTSAGPDGRRMVTDRRRPGPDHMSAFGNLPILPETICEVLPRADAYRIWRPASTRMTTPPPGTAWRAPDVFNDFAPMPALEDIDPIANNLEMMMQAINTDGVCPEIGIVLVPFEDPRGLLLPASWYLNMAGVKQALNEIHETSVSGKHYLQYIGGKVPVIEADDMILDNSPVRSPLKGVDEGIRYNDIALAGYAGLQTLGFMSKEQIANYQAEVPLDRSPIDELLLIAGTSCHGEPMRYKVSGTNKELELYAFVRALIVVPYWLDYQDGSPEAQGFWQKHVNYLLRHEMMHLYDFVDIVNEAVFRMKGEIDLKNEMIAKRARPYEAARMGAFNYSQYEFKTYFGTHIDNLKKGIGVANNYFHHAIYAADLEGKKTDHFDIDMKTRAPKLPSWGETQHTYRVAEACLAVPVLQAVGFPDEYEKMKQICAQGG